MRYFLNNFIRFLSLEKIVGDYLYSCGQDVQPESAVQYSNMYRYVQDTPVKYSNMYRYVQKSCCTILKHVHVFTVLKNVQVCTLYRR